MIVKVEEPRASEIPMIRRCQIVFTWFHFTADGVIHCSVANMPGAVPYTSTVALTNATLPYVIRIAEVAMDVLIRTSLEVRTGLNIYKGEITHSAVAQAFDLKYTPADKLI